MFPMHPWRPWQRRSRGATLRCSALVIALTAVPADAPAQTPRPVETTQTASVTGSVYDSLSNAPLAQATVRVVLASDLSTGQTRTTDADGRFAFDSLPLGTWLATFYHPVADSLAISPPVARLEVREATELQLALAIPRARTLITGRCGPGVGADTTLGYLYGLVRRSDDDRPLASASVSFEWPEWVLQRREVRTEMQRVHVLTDSAGWYSACGLPSDAVVRTVAWSERDSTGALAVDVPVDGWRRRDFWIASTRIVEAAESTSGDQPDSLELSRVTVRVGDATLRGRVVDENGRPLTDATVRLLGTGRSVRTRADGGFELLEAAAGSQTVEARSIGFSPARHAVELRDGQATNVDMVLAVRHIALDTVRVVANRSVNSQVAAFEARWRRGTGVFLNDWMLRRRVFRFLGDALVSLNGVRVQQVGGYGQRIIMRGLGGGFCMANLFVDGARMNTGRADAELFLDDLVIWTEVVGVEVYTSGSATPAEYVDAMGCGAVAVWTRARFDGVSPRPPEQRKGRRRD